MLTHVLIPRNSQYTYIYSQQGGASENISKYEFSIFVVNFLLN